jgi:type I restriction enzyme, S subunit
MAETLNTKPFYNTAIPSDWEVKKGEEISLKITKGSSPNWQGFQYQNSGVLFVTSENVRDGFLDVSVPKYLPISFNDKLKNSILKKGDILINIVGASIGRCCIYNLETVANINQAVCLLRPNDTPEAEYISYFLQLPKSIERLLGTQSDSARPNLTLEDIRNFKFLLPPLPEQRAISKALSLMDTAININMQLIAQKELRKKWLMQNLLTGKKRLKGFSGDWKENKLSNLFERVTRKNTEGNTTVVTISAQRGFVRQTDFFNKNIASEITDNYFLVKNGEFCYNKSYSNGYPWGATKRLNDFDKAVVTTLYICFGIIDESKINGDYFEQFFEANYLDKGLTKIAHEGGRAHGLLNVTPNDFFSLKIIVPSYEEQTAIAKVLQAADKEIELLKTKTEKLREQKKGMMQVLLTGKKRLNQDAQD